MNDPLQFAIIGCGKIAPRHAREISRIGRLVAVCDIIPERADELASAHNAKAYYKLEELLADNPGIDIISVCTPNGLHAEHSILSLENDHHVLCEKPLCISVADGKKMIEHAAKAKKKLWVVKSARFNPIIEGLKKNIDSESLGKIYSFQLNCFWNRPKAYYENSWRGTSLDGGTLFTQFSHYIDAILWLFGEPGPVSGFRKNFSHQDCIESEDSGVVSVEMTNGIIGGINWSVNSFEKNMEISLSLLASGGSIRVSGEYLDRIEYQHVAGPPISFDAQTAPNDYGHYKGSMSHHDKVYQNLVKAVRNGDHSFTDATDGIKTVAFIEKIYSIIPLS
jgi:UDP-N-acetyl-2-amino-2-deoxyglucuronate dehydrogenase